MTSGQALALEQLYEIAEARPDLIEVLEAQEEDSGLLVQLSIDCRRYRRVSGALPLRKRERFVVYVPSGFPFAVPKIKTPHARFGGYPHVQWRRHLCLYQSSGTEWSPSDGMFGFVNRLDRWLRQAALGELDPVGAPLHPPVAYVGFGYTTVIPHVDTPVVEGAPWFGFAHLDIRSERRVDITGWTEVSDVPPAPVAATILLSEPMPFEFPDKLGGLLKELEERGVSRRLMLSALRIALLSNEDETPLYLVVGTPMRGVRGSTDLRQHLAVWSVAPKMAEAVRLSLLKHADDPDTKRIGEEVESILLKWMEEANADWCLVREDRPEIVTRRDHSSAVSWFAGRTVSLWGCGALGSRVAEFLCRAGVRKLLLHDDGVVAPGLLVRQPFDDDDVGRAKASVLKERLQRARPDVEVEASTRDLLGSVLEADDWTEGADVIIDTTASIGVLRKLELVRRTSEVSPVTVVSMAVGHKAENSLLAVSLAAHSGGVTDVLRRAKLAVCDREHLVHFADEFYPKEHRADPFQPEPGCSESTFVGSAADVTALAGEMLNQAAQMLSREGGSETAFAHFAKAAHQVGQSAGPASASFSWESDQECVDLQSGYEVRIAESAWREILGWVSENRRTRGPRVETGGVLFGERDDASGILWVSDAIGPPPDSERAAEGFVCGTEGVQEAHAERKERTRGASQYLGMWHIHPGMEPVPSPTDFEGMRRLVGSTGRASRSLLLIVSTTEDEADFTLGTYVFSRKDFSRDDLPQFRLCVIHAARPQERACDVGLALSGGGSRAIAFHLGCLRALHDRGVLDRLHVVSAVSGGSVIAGMYAYSHDSFEQFDRRVVELLKRGLVGEMARRAALSPLLLKSLATLVVSGILAVFADVARVTLLAGRRILGLGERGTMSRLHRLQPPFRRWANRTDALVATLRARLFGDANLTDARRDDIGIVVGACELRTGSAFRFGSRESRCWRLGAIKGNQVRVAEAVAASAAYPLLLPALDRSYTLVSRDGNEIQERVLLADGGLFDNLGTTCLEPGRDPSIGSNTYSPDYIICCDAGQGLLSDHVLPYWWPSRVARSFESVFRKAHDGGVGRLFGYLETGQLKGLIMPYLGQREGALPYVPPDLVRREEVVNYPTDFSPMSVRDIERISRRGEQLTRMLIARYNPEL